MYDKKYLPAHIANYFIWKADQDKIEDLTSMKLIKFPPNFRHMKTT